MRDETEIKKAYKDLGVDLDQYPTYKNAEEYAKHLTKDKPNLWIKSDFGSGSIINKSPTDA